MTSDLNDMIEELKKEISDNLTRRITYTPYDVAKENNYDKNKKKENFKFIIPITGFLISLIFLGLFVFNVLNIINNKPVGNKIINSAKVNVILNNNSFDENESNTSYLASLISKVNIDFINNVDTNNYSFDKSVVLALLITDANDDNSVIYKKSEDLISNYKGLYTDESKNKLSVSIDYSKYNNMINKYKRSIDIVNNSRLEVLYTNNITIDGKVKKVMQKVIIPLSKSMVDIKKEYKNVEYLNSSDEQNWSSYVYYLIFMAIVFIPSLIYLVILINKRKNTLSVLERKYNKIMKDYNSIIIEVEDDTFKDKLAVITVKYFVDLIDAQQELHVPILCYTDLKTGITSFYLVTDKYVYKYILNKSDEKL